MENSNEQHFLGLYIKVCNDYHDDMKRIQALIAKVEEKFEKRMNEISPLAYKIMYPDDQQVA